MDLDGSSRASIFRPPSQQVLRSHYEIARSLYQPNETFAA